METFFPSFIKSIRYFFFFVLASFLSTSAFAVTTSCGSGSSLVFMEQTVASPTISDVTNRTIPVSHNITINVKWNYANSIHSTSRWYVELSSDSSVSNTGGRLSVDSFTMGPIFVGGYPTPLSVGQHLVKSRLVFEDGRTCEISAPYKVESVDTIGQITSIDANGLVTGCGYQRGHDTGTSTVIFTKPSVKFTVGGVNLGSTTADKAVPAAASSVCPAGTGFSFALTPKQLSDSAGGTLQASISLLNTDVVFASKRIGAPVTGLLQHVGGLCAYIIGGSPTNAGQAMGLAGCTEATVAVSPSTITLRSDGNLEVKGFNGWCLHPEGGSSNPGNGTRLVIWPACGESRLAFELTAAGSLRHIASGKCIHPQGGSATPAVGTQLVFWDSCDENRLKFKFLP